MVELRDIIDTWSMIEKYGIEDYDTRTAGVVKISEGAYNRMLYGSKNKNYIKNLLASHGRFCSHGYI